MEPEPQPVVEGGEGYEGGPGVDSPGDQQPDGGAPPDTGQPPQGGDPVNGEQPRQTRMQRRAEFNANLELKAQLKRQDEQNQQLTRQLAEAMRRMAESQEAMRPPREDPLVTKRNQLNERWQKVVSRLDKDPGAADEFRDLQFEYGRLGAQEEARQQQQNAPRPPSALIQSLTMEFPWLHPETGDNDARTMANGYAARIAKLEKRNMRDPQVLYTTLRQAAALVAKDLGYPVPSVGGDHTNGRDRMAGAGGRGGPGGNGAPPDFTGMEADIEAAATVMYPNVEKAAAVAKWKNGPGRSLRK